MLISLTAHAGKTKKTTTYSKCERSVDGAKPQIIIVAMETLTENQCKSFGQKKAELYSRAGWKCLGLHQEELFSCENAKSQSFAFYNGIKLDHMTFTNLEKHKSLLAYLNPKSNQLCHEDKAELIEAGVKDAVCHKRHP